MKARWSTSDAVQARILDAAMETFMTYGYADAKLTEVASTAGVSIGSIYHHFEGKDGLYSACHARLRDHLRARIGIDLDTALVQGIWEPAYLAAAREHAAECLVFLAGDAPSSFSSILHAARYYSELNPNVGRMMSAILVEGLRLVCECQDDEVTGVIDGTVTLLKLAACVKF